MPNVLGIGNEAAGFMYIKLQRKSSIVNSMELIWRHHPESNRRWRFCRPLPYRLAMVPFGRVKGGNAAVKKNGAGNGARTRHLRLGKAALYQMSYSRSMVPQSGVEPPTQGFSVPCSTS